MEALGKIFQMCIEFAKTPITIGEFTFSFWGVFLLLAVFGVICELIGGVLNGK